MRRGRRARPRRIDRDRAGRASARRAATRASDGPSGRRRRSDLGLAAARRSWRPGLRRHLFGGGLRRRLRALAVGLGRGLGCVVARRRFGSRRGRARPCGLWLRPRPSGLDDRLAAGCGRLGRLRLGLRRRRLGVGRPRPRLGGGLLRDALRLRPAPRRLAAASAAARRRPRAARRLLGDRGRRTPSRRRAAAALASATDTSLRMSIRQPVRRAASRAFWPSRPIASDSIRSGTVTLAIRCSSSMSTEITCAGLSALATNTAGSSLHGMTSIFSPDSSATTAWTRAPRWPTVAPTGSRPSWRDATAIFERLPASRAIALISTVPLWISGTSSSNRRLRKPLWVRLTKICGPFVERRTSSTNALTFWPIR